MLRVNMSENSDISSFPPPVFLLVPISILFLNTFHSCADGPKPDFSFFPRLTYELYWMHVAQDRNQCWAFVNTVMNQTGS